MVFNFLSAPLNRVTWSHGAIESAKKSANPDEIKLGIQNIDPWKTKYAFNLPTKPGTFAMSMVIFTVVSLASQLLFCFVCASGQNCVTVLICVEWSAVAQL